MSKSLDFFKQHIDKPIDVTYDVIGKGSLVYHWVKNYVTDWELIGNHYHAGDNVKLIFKKK
jgi:hypothetical protein